MLFFSISLVKNMLGSSESCIEVHELMEVKYDVEVPWSRTPSEEYPGIFRQKANQELMKIRLSLAHT